MVLLHAMHKLQSKWKWQLAVSHIDHVTRAGKSLADRKFVEAATNKLNLPFTFFCWEKRGSSFKGGFENAARMTRLKFHAKAADKHRCSIVVVAHHLDDQVETFLWKMMRGGSGLTGMGSLGGFPGQPHLRLARPFLALRKGDLIAYAKRHQVQFVEDESNSSTEHLRNRVRHQVLPTLREAFDKDPVEAITQTQDLIGAESDFAKRMAVEWLRNPTMPFNELHTAVQRWVVAGQLESLGGELKFTWVEHLRLRPNTPLSIASHQVVIRDDSGRIKSGEVGQLEFATDSIHLIPKNQWQQVASANSNVRYRVCRQQPRRVEGEIFDADRIGEMIYLRHWRPGDRFRAIGMPSATKLQDQFTNAKVRATDKRQRLIACTEADEIFWVEGLRIGEMAKVRPSTVRFLKWICQKS